MIVKIFNGLQKLEVGDSNCLSKTFELVQVENIGVLKRMRE